MNLSCEEMKQLYSEHCCDTSAALPSNGTIWCTAGDATVMSMCEDLRLRYRASASGCQCPQDAQP